MAQAQLLRVGIHRGAALAQHQLLVVQASGQVQAQLGALQLGPLLLVEGSEAREEALRHVGEELGLGQAPDPPGVVVLLLDDLGVEVGLEDQLGGLLGPVHALQDLGPQHLGDQLAGLGLLVELQHPEHGAGAALEHLVLGQRVELIDQVVLGVAQGLLEPLQDQRLELLAGRVLQLLDQVDQEPRARGRRDHRPDPGQDRGPLPRRDQLQQRSDPEGQALAVLGQQVGDLLRLHQRLADALLQVREQPQALAALLRLLHHQLHEVLVEAAQVVPLQRQGAAVEHRLQLPGGGPAGPGQQHPQPVAADEQGQVRVVEHQGGREQRVHARGAVLLGRAVVGAPQQLADVVAAAGAEQRQQQAHGLVHRHQVGGAGLDALADQEAQPPQRRLVAAAGRHQAPRLVDQAVAGPLPDQALEQRVVVREGGEQPQVEVGRDRR